MPIELTPVNNFENTQPIDAVKLYESFQQLATASRDTRHPEMWGMFAWSLLAGSDNSEERQAAQIQLATIAGRATNEISLPAIIGASTAKPSIKQQLAISRLALAQSELSKS